MPFERIESIDDPRVWPYRDLPTSRLPRESGLFIAEGRTLVERLLASDYAVASVLLEDRFAEAIGPLVPRDVPILLAERQLVQQIVGFRFHRGVMACGRRRASPTLEELLPVSGKPWTFVVCPDVQDPENLGGVLRNSAAFGADAVLLGSQTPDPFSRRTLRVSMGNALKLPLRESNDLAADLKRLRHEYGVQLIASVLDPDAERLEAVKRPERLAVLFGGEGYGLERRWIELCDRRVTIDMSLNTDSLNVAVASGIFLYHFTRRAV